MTSREGPAELSTNEIRDALVEQARSIGLSGTADRLAANLDLLPPPSSMPLIVDTDIGGDPDDAVAIAVAAGLPELALVITSDEHGGRRARFARHLLDLLGRRDVVAVAGIDLGIEKYWAAQGLVPSDVPTPDGDVVGAVRRVLERADGKVRWLGIVPSNVTFHPENEITTESEEYRQLDRAGGPWMLIRAHMDQWFATFHPGTMQHDAMALAQAMMLPF